MKRIAELSIELNISAQRIASYLQLHFTNNTDLLNYALNEKVIKVLIEKHTTDKDLKQKSSKIEILSTKEFRKKIKKKLVDVENMPKFYGKDIKKKRKKNLKPTEGKYKCPPKGINRKPISAGLMNGK
jgi:hypothetical protein